MSDDNFLSPEQFDALGDVYAVTLVYAKALDGVDSTIAHLAAQQTRKTARKLIEAFPRLKAAARGLV
jgi:hypothetical protein